jgi:hypothetical protein
MRGFRKDFGDGPRPSQPWPSTTQTGSQSRNPHTQKTGQGHITRRVDFALFMVEALDNDELVHKAPAIVGRQTPSALAYAA